MNLIAARDLRVGDRVKTENDIGVIREIGFDKEKLIFGGQTMKTARALKIILEDARVFFIHPGSLIHSDQVTASAPSLLRAHR